MPDQTLTLKVVLTNREKVNRLCELLAETRSLLAELAEGGLDLVELPLERREVTREAER